MNNAHYNNILKWENTTAIEIDLKVWCQFQKEFKKLHDPVNNITFIHIRNRQRLNIYAALLDLHFMIQALRAQYSTNIIYAS